jgi:hypothetical protein
MYHAIETSITTVLEVRSVEDEVACQLSFCTVVAATGRLAWLGGGIQEAHGGSNLGFAYGEWFAWLAALAAVSWNGLQQVNELGNSKPHGRAARRSCSVPLSRGATGRCEAAS